MKQFKKIYVEISNVCNLQCDFCPEVERDKKIMSQETFERVIAQVAPLTEEVCFHLMGEPLTHPRFSEFLDICASHSLPVNITTNGTLLNKAHTAALLKPIVRQVNFSLQSFENNFPKKDLEPYLEKVFSFTSHALSTRPDLYINYRLWNMQGKSSIGDTNSKVLQKISQTFGVTVKPQIHVDWNKSKKIIGRLYLHFDSRFEWPHPQAPIRNTTGFCHGLSSHIGIHADGTVVPCCLDKEAILNLGNCTTHALQEIIAGPKATRIAKGFLKNQLVEDLCRRCQFIERFGKKLKPIPVRAAPRI